MRGSELTGLALVPDASSPTPAFLPLAQPDLARAAVEVGDYVRRDGDHQLVVVFLPGVANHRHVKPGNEAKPGDPAHRPHVIIGNFTGNECRLAVLQVDAGLVFAIRNHRYSVFGLPSQRAHLQFKLQADHAIAVNGRLGFQIQS